MAASPHVLNNSANRAIPARWRSVSLALLALSQHKVAPVSAVPLPRTDPVTDDAVTALWIAAVVDESTHHKSVAVRAALRAVSRVKSLNSLARWRVVDACEREQLQCTQYKRSQIAENSHNGPVGWALDVWASVELSRRGYMLEGPPIDQVMQAASSRLSKLADGNDVEAAALARAIHAGGGGPELFAAYLHRAQSRLDRSSGLYRQHVEFVGTIDNTYEAKLALGDAFTALADAHGTFHSVEDSLERDQSMNDATKARALAIVAGHHPLTTPQQAIRDDIVRRIEQRSYSVDDARSLAAILEALLNAGITVPGVTVKPALVTNANEGVVDAILVLAQDHVLANSDEILTYYDSYVVHLPSAITSDGITSPWLFYRLAVLDGADVDWGQQVAAVAAIVSHRIGCTGHPAMARATGDPRHPLDCDLAQTALLVNTQFGVEYDRDDR
ncbi:hypothetical protein LK09_12950 [Microbacterium mangrovi]|uniref:Uncharacterized protein n=1 Tax=Microbacterium mangrovi TaxID=1348253 RepID=A0A0B2A115_9MICO|nr:hypothetical protein LK09_12950 [Microbacterium mangrovi]